MKIVLSVFAVLGSLTLVKVIWVWDASTASSSKGVIIDVDTSKAPDLAPFAAKVKVTLEEWYSPIKSLLHSNQFKEVDRVKLRFDPNYNGVAYAIWDQKLIVGSVQYYRQNPDDIGSMVHELVHIIQQYPWNPSGYGNCPGWITEGIADWVRNYIYEPHNKPDKPWVNQHYTNGYRVSAYFLEYLNTKWPFWDQGLNRKMVNWINMDCRSGHYRDTVFKNMLGKTADEFWTEMMSTKGKFNVEVDTTQAPEMYGFALRVKQTLEAWYPYFAEKLDSPTFQPVETIKVKFVPSMNGAMGSHSLQNRLIVGSAEYFKKNEDMGFWIKNMIHMIQQYTGNTCPSWVKSGIADWAWYWHVEPGKKPGKPWNGSSYNNGWWTAAYLLNFLDERYQPQGKSVTNWLNRKCREDNYNDNVVKQLTGKSTDEQWTEMMKTL